MRRSLLTLLALGLGGLLLAAPAHAKRGLGPMPLIGYNDNFNRFEPHDSNAPDDILPLLSIGGSDPEPEPRRAKLIRAARRGGAEVIRYDVPWLRVERKRGSFDWRVEDRTYELAREAGLRPLIVLITSPCWAHPSVACDAPGHNAIRPDRDYLDEYGEFARRVARRYPKAVAIEVWNESNSRLFWGPDPSPGYYQQMLSAVWRATRGVEQRPTILYNGLMPLLGSNRYLRRSFHRFGAARRSDAAGVHPYVGRGTPKRVRGRIRRTRRILRRAGAPRRVWITEIGWSTNERAPASIPPIAQSVYIERVERIARKQRVRAMVVHRLKDIEHDDPWEEGLGALRLDGSPKPLYCTMVARHRPGAVLPEGC